MSMVNILEIIKCILNIVTSYLYKNYNIYEILNINIIIKIFITNF